MTTIDKISGEIEVDLMEQIIKTLPKLKAIHSINHSILIHGMGGKTRHFYRVLRNNNSTELLWTGWSSNIWWTYLLSFISGQAGLTKVIERQKLDKLYLDIGAQSMCGLYFIPNGRVTSVLDKIRRDRMSDISDLFDKEGNYFLLTIDFDYHGGDKDGEIFYRELILGDDLDEEIKLALIRTK